MAERGKAEKSQHAEAHIREAELDEKIRSLADEFIHHRGRSPTGGRLYLLWEDPAGVDVDVEAKLASTGIQVVPTGEFAKQLSQRMNRPRTDLLSEPDEPFERDDFYYEEVRAAVGIGTPSVLFGTSNRELDRNLRQLQIVEGHRDEPLVDSKGDSPVVRWLLWLVTILLSRFSPLRPRDTTFDLENRDHGEREKDESTSRADQK